MTPAQVRHLQQQSARGRAQTQRSLPNTRQIAQAQAIHRTGSASPLTTGASQRGFLERQVVPRPPVRRTTPVGGGSRATGGTGGVSGGGGSRATSAPARGPGGFTSPAAQQAAQRQTEQRRQQELEQLRRSIREQPLDPSLIAQFAARERAAGRALSEAEVAAERGRSQAQIDFEQFIRQLEGRTGDAIGALRGEAAARNLAFQPAFVGVGMRDIRDEAATAQGQAQQHRAQFLTGIDRQLQQAQQAREAEVAAIARERARAEADHRGFIQRQLDALR